MEYATILTILDCVSCSLRSCYMKFQHWSWHCPLDWRRTKNWSGVPRVFQESHICQGAWKTVRNTFQSPNVLQSKRQCPKMCKNKGTNLYRNLPRNKILSPWLEYTRTLEYISNSFPGTLMCMLFLENFWNSAPMCSFSPIQGTVSWLVLKFHVTRIWELDVTNRSM